ncbi:MAG: DnaJ domain-containing protein [Chitinophagaceae bacterium]|nr:DnaJ domain-containing protein [Chitinophagaceae bacterium]
MDYFELFQLPVSLKVDKKQVEKKYYQLCREFHPDHIPQEDSAKIELALSETARIHAARTVLEDANKRLEYLLKEKGHILPDEKYSLPPAFLAEMMDLNEQLMELEFEPNEDVSKEVKQALTALEQHLSEEVKPYFEMDTFVATDNEWEMLKAYYYKRKYLQRVAEKLV